MAQRVVGAVVVIFLCRRRTICTILQPMGSTGRLTEEISLPCRPIRSKKTWSSTHFMSSTAHSISWDSPVTRGQPEVSELARLVLNGESTHAVHQEHLVFLNHTLSQIRAFNKKQLCTLPSFLFTVPMLGIYIVSMNKVYHVFVLLCSVWVLHGWDFLGNHFLSSSCEFSP